MPERAQGWPGLPTAWGRVNARNKSNNALLGCLPPYGVGPGGCAVRYYSAPVAPMITPYLSTCRHAGPSLVILPHFVPSPWWNFGRCASLPRRSASSSQVHRKGRFRLIIDPGATSYQYHVVRTRDGNRDAPGRARVTRHIRRYRPASTWR